jgi:hypothetical protein
MEGMDSLSTDVVVDGGKNPHLGVGFPSLKMTDTTTATIKIYDRISEKDLLLCSTEVDLRDLVINRTNKIRLPHAKGNGKAILEIMVSPADASSFEKSIFEKTVELERQTGQRCITLQQGVGPKKYITPCYWRRAIGLFKSSDQDVDSESFTASKASLEVAPKSIEV